MGTVSITFIDGSVKHFVDATCCLGVLRIHVHQYQEGNKIKRYHFDKKQIMFVLLSVNLVAQQSILPTGVEYSRSGSTF